MTIEKKPFKNYTLEEDRKETKGSVLTIRLNENERIWLNELKVLMDIKNDATALKKAAIIGHNVIHSLFTPDVWKYYANRRREKYEKL